MFLIYFFGTVGSFCDVCYVARDPVVRSLQRQILIPRVPCQDVEEQQPRHDRSELAVAGDAVKPCRMPRCRGVLRPLEPSLRHGMAWRTAAP